MTHGFDVQEPLGLEADARDRGAQLRPAQEEALAYRGGRLAITAAPGAGKTFILTRLVAHLVADLGARSDEIVVLTYMRSAALTFRHRAAAELARRGHSARGLTVCTIHSFCLRISSQSSARTGPTDDRDVGHADDRLEILAEPEQYAVLRAGLAAYLADPARSAAFRRLGDPDGRARETLESARRAIAAAKHAGVAPDALDGILSGAPEVAYLARHYAEHQRATRRPDFDDLLLRAVGILRSNQALLAHYRQTCRYLLEDEAQDSTPVQNELLELLAGPDGNLVRVGDPDQAIMSSFTNSSPGLFRAFCERSGTLHMSESSRSALPIIALANRLVALAGEHRVPAVRAGFGAEPIRAATAGPRNPAAHAVPLSWHEHRDRPEEIARVVEAVRRHLREHPSDTCAILCAANGMIQHADGTGYLPAARAAGLDVHGDRDGRPGSGTVLAALRAAFEAASTLLDLRRAPQSALAAFAEALAAARGLQRPARAALTDAFGEAGADWLRRGGGLRPSRPAGVPEPAYALLLDAADLAESLFAARQLPPAELLLAAGALVAPGDEQAALLAARLGRLASSDGPDHGVAPELQASGAALRRIRDQLAELADTGRGARLLADTLEAKAPVGGQVVITTLHRSKGAEYDAVWIPNLGYDLAGSRSYFPWEPAEVAIFDEAAIVAERRTRGDAPGPALLDGYRAQCIAERLRLLYVGITRARRRLTLSCHSSGRGSAAPAHVLALARECSA